MATQAAEQVRAVSNDVRTVRGRARVAVLTGRVQTLLIQLRRAGRCLSGSRVYRRLDIFEGHGLVSLTQACCRLRGTRCTSCVMPAMRQTNCRAVPLELGLHGVELAGTGNLVRQRGPLNCHGGQGSSLHVARGKQDPSGCCWWLSCVCTARRRPGTLQRQATACRSDYHRVSRQNPAPPHPLVHYLVRVSGSLQLHACQTSRAREQRELGQSITQCSATL